MSRHHRDNNHLKQQTGTNRKAHIIQVGLILVSSIFGLITTLNSYRGYGLGNQIEQLPIILRDMDPAYLSEDFFTNQTVDSIARMNYSRLLAGMAGSPDQLPAVFFLLTTLSNVGISIITMLTARKFFKNVYAGLIAAGAVMSLNTFNLGSLPIIYADALTPGLLVYPLVLGAFYVVIFYGRILPGIMLAGLASLIHPLLGLEMGILLLATEVIQVIINDRSKVKQLAWKFIISSLVWLLFALPVWGNYRSQPEIETHTFIKIIARFRHPHHYLPSTFGLSEYLLGILFLGTIILAIIRWKPGRKPAFRFIILLLLICLLCLGGYIFVEILPSRIWAAAQMFRLLLFIKWLGLIMAVGWAWEVVTILVTALQEGVRQKGKGDAFVRSFLEEYRASMDDPQSRCGASLSIPMVLGMDLIGILLLTQIIHGNMDLFIKYLIFVVLFVLLLKSPLGKKFPLIAISFALVLSFLSLFKASFFPFRERYLNRGVSLVKIGRDGATIAGYAADHSPVESIFLTPPDWGQFRLIAERAIVVDFKAFPFADEAMLAWYQRMINCYCLPDQAGFDMLNELEHCYRNLDDSKILDLKDRYGISYAVLYRGQDTSFPEVFHSGRYKIVDLR